jgi:N-acetylmuramoyl-L-alanine amidase
LTVIHPRADWDFTGWARDADGREIVPPTVPDRVRTEFLTHYEGGHPCTDTGAAAMRAIHRIHLANGWSGIGYNHVVMLDGSAWEGRGWSLVGAHCPNHNRVGYGVQIHLGGAQKPTDAALATQRALYDEACRRAGHSLRMLGHRDGYATECPGDTLEAWVQEGMPMPGGRPSPAPLPAPKPSPGVPAPAFPLPGGSYFGPKLPLSNARSVSGWFQRLPSGRPGHPGLLRWQQRMQHRGWDIAADGLYGPQTASVARHFEIEKHLGVDQGLIGSQVWAAAWTAPITH